MLLVGIDEVGYGPKLGPLIVCAAVARVERRVDLWKEWRRWVARQRGGHRLPVCDSKILFNQRRGLSVLEPTTAAFLTTSGQFRPSFRELHRGLSIRPADPMGMPWYREEDLILPLTGSVPRLSVPFVGAWTNVVEVSEFNRRAGSNKADLLFDLVAELIRYLLRRYPDETISICVGKQGGRIFYARHLMQKLGFTWVLEESPEQSIYRLGGGAEISFLLDGEDRDFLIALASIIGKYLREGSMLLFNRYWQRRIAGLRHTAGYGNDGGRFYRTIAPHAERWGMTPADLLRRR